MQGSERVADIFADAWALYADPIEVLAFGKHRLAAEAAWGATKRATDALVLARTGREPSGTGQTSGGIRFLSWENPEIAALRESFQEAVRELHSDCFYLGECGQPEALSQIIRDTADYIREAAELAES